MRAETRRQSVTLVTPSWKHVHHVTQVIHHDVRVPKRSQSKVRRFTNTKLAQSEERVYFQSLSMWFPHSMVASGQPDSPQSSGWLQGEHSSKQDAASPFPTQTHHLKTCLTISTALKWLQASTKPIQHQNKGQRPPPPEGGGKALEKKTCRMGTWSWPSLESIICCIYFTDEAAEVWKVQ